MPIPWNLMIQFIIWLISIGMPKTSAVKATASKFGVSEQEIFKRGGF